MQTRILIGFEHFSSLGYLGPTGCSKKKKKTKEAATSKCTALVTPASELQARTPLPVRVITEDRSNYKKKIGGQVIRTRLNHARHDSLSNTGQGISEGRRRRDRQWNLMQNHALRHLTIFLIEASDLPETGGLAKSRKYCDS